MCDEPDPPLHRGGASSCRVTIPRFGKPLPRWIVIESEPTWPYVVRKRVTQTMTRTKNDNESAEESGHFLIKPDPDCPECTKIMVWRSAHRGIVITDGTKIRLLDAPWGSRHHLHVRDVGAVRLKNVEPRRKERETKDCHPVASPGRVRRQSVSPFLRSPALASGRERFGSPTGLPWLTSHHAEGVSGPSRVNRHRRAGVEGESRPCWQDF